MFIEIFLYFFIERFISPNKNLKTYLFEEFKKIAIAENRTVGNLGATVIQEFLAKKNIK